MAKTLGLTYIRKQILLNRFGGRQSKTLGHRTSIIEIVDVMLETVVYIVPDGAQN